LGPSVRSWSPRPPWPQPVTNQHRRTPADGPVEPVRRRRTIGTPTECKGGRAHPDVTGY
jgi:hypothetical protein